ncbi:MAG: peptide deformylase [Candidatus Shikimatogenerans sp. Ttur]|uniref:Peptide deformylase n=1 Tax=Candidatus Shikimatogenerans sp. Ttur TaxID=3158569 RepID=A0AAU7ZY53_9FLAO
MYNLIYYNNPILRKKCFNIKKNSNLKKIINYMIFIMNINNGIGISAPQIGINFNLFIFQNIKKKKYNIFYNSKIIKFFGKNKIKHEGCLSIPGIYKKIPRKNSILIKYYNNNWEKKIKTYSSYTSRIIQHEYDHIKGVLFIDLFKKKKEIKKKLYIINKKYNLQ